MSDDVKHNQKSHCVSSTESDINDVLKGGE